MSRNTQDKRGNTSIVRKLAAKLHLCTALVILFMIVLLTAANVFSKDRKMSEKENRNLAAVPEVSLDRIVSGRFMEDFETYLSDQFVCRDLWVSAKTFLDSFTGKNYANGVYKGKDGYLIEDAAVPSEEQVQDNIAAINTLADSGDAAVYTMIVPNAVSILPDKLPAFAPVRSQEQDLASFRSRLSANVQDINVEKVLSAHRDEDIYYRTDHHWTTTGAYYAFTAAAASLGLDADQIKYNIYKVSNDFKGTMASASGYACKPDTIEVYVPETSSVQYVIEYVEEQKKSASVYQSAQLETYDKYTFFLGGNSPLMRIKTTNEDGGRLLLVKDSYANCFLPFLIPYYKEIVVVDPRYYYEDIFTEIENEEITDILFLYNANTFFTDNSISGVFMQGD